MGTLRQPHRSEPQPIVPANLRKSRREWLGDTTRMDLGSSSSEIEMA